MAFARLVSLIPPSVGKVLFVDPFCDGLRNPHRAIATFVHFFWPVDNEDTGHIPEQSADGIHANAPKFCQLIRFEVPFVVHCVEPGSGRYTR